MPVSIPRVRPTVARRSGLALLLLVAFVLRVWNLDWDDGTHQHPDERYWSIVTADISAPEPTEYFDSARSPLNPYNHRDTWVYGTLPLFVNKAVASFLTDGPFPAGAIVTTADTLGIDLRNDGVDAFDAGYNANLVGRLLSALFDTATVAMVYLLGRDLFDRRAGFVGATLLAFTPLHIQYAHFFGAEPWVTFFVTAGIWMSIKLARGDLRARTAAATGAVFGMAVASKLIAAAALVVPATAILIAVTPSVLDAGRTAVDRARTWCRADPPRAWASAIATSAALVVVLAAPQLSIGTVAQVSVGALFAGVVVYALGVVQPAARIRAERSAAAPLADGDDPSSPHDGPTDPPPFHVAVWGAFVGGVVVASTLVVYRILQPYTFEGVASIDPRFTADLDYLQDVNSGGNVPWVVQWIGRTPLLFPLTSAFWWGMGPAVAIATVAGIGRACVEVVRGRRWLLLLPLVYLAMMLGLVSQQFNPLIRYLLPAYPAAIALGGYGVVSIWDAGCRVMARAAAGARATGQALRVVAVGLVAVGVLWGLAFVNGVYNTDHPRIEASLWMAENLPDGAVLSTQIWDDSLPLPIRGTEGFAFTHVALDPFQPDRVPGKVDALIAGLDEVDYVVEASNRLYDSIPRVPARYPSTTAYYEALFDGRLGFEQVARFRNSPSLFGIDIPDHFAEETFTVYDHPTVTVWAKTADWSPQRAAAILNPAAAEIAPDLIPSEAASNALMFRPDDPALNEVGSTFDDAFEPSGALGSFHWIWWLAWLQLCAFAVLPWSTRLFSGLPDKGYGPAKAIGFVSVGLATWLTVSWGVADYGRGLIWLWFAAVALAGMVAWGRSADHMTELWRTHRRSWLGTEAIFLAVFGLALWMRSANPDLWEAYLGGEKPMEMAYITAIARSSEFPAVDPWFAGGYMNYYYFGWYLLTVPMRALRIAPEIGFNLGVATYAALTATVAFSVVHNLVALSRRRWGRGSPERPPGPEPDPTPVRAGVLGVILLMGIGNLDAIRLHYDRLAAVNEWDTASGVPIIGHIEAFLGGTWQWLTGTPLARFDWWAPSRVNRGNFDITEFPYFTFLFGDLHPHMMGMVFVGLVVTTVIAHLVASRDGRTHLAFATAVGLGLLTGVVRAVNTWDLPSTLILTGAAIVIGRAIAPPPERIPARQRPVAVLVGALALAAGLSTGGGPGGSALMALAALGLAALVAAALPVAPAHRVLTGIAQLSLAAVVHVALFWPYLRSNEPIDTGLQSAVAGSPLDGFLVHWGIFLVLAVALAAALVVDARRRSRVGHPPPGPLPDAVWASPLWRAGWATVGVVAVVFTGRMSTGAATISVAGVIVFGALLLVELRRDQRDIGRIVAVGLFTLGFAIAGGVDVVTVQNDIERMNTVFKFWLQSWQYFALAGAFAVWQVDRVLRERTEEVIEPGKGATRRIGASRSWPGTAWGVVVGLIVLAGLAYPLLGTRTRLETRFAQIPVTLDGLAYLEADPEIRRIAPDGEGEITVRLAEDLPLIEWIRANVAGQPGLVEWAGAGYDWNARIAIHTGLPTVLGWDWHQKQQRWDHQELVDQRLRAVTEFYTAGNEATITRFLQAYDVGYVIVGTQERRFGRAAALEAIASHPALDPVFVSGDNAVYRVDRDGLWPGVDVAALDLEALGG